MWDLRLCQHTAFPSSPMAGCISDISAHRGSVQTQRSAQFHRRLRRTFYSIVQQTHSTVQLDASGQLSNKTIGKDLNLETGLYRNAGNGLSFLHFSAVPHSCLLQPGRAVQHRAGSWAMMEGAAIRMCASCSQRGPPCSQGWRRDKRFEEVSE